MEVQYGGSEPTQLLSSSVLGESHEQQPPFPGPQFPHCAMQVTGGLPHHWGSREIGIKHRPGLSSLGASPQVIVVCGLQDSDPSLGSLLCITRQQGKSGLLQLTVFPYGLCMSLALLPSSATLKALGTPCNPPR